MKQKTTDQGMLEIMEALRSSGERPRLLLNSCCGPCSTAVLEQLIQVFDVTVHFYNPNLHSQAEYDRRAEAQQQVLADMKLPLAALLARGWSPEAWQDAVGSTAFEGEGGVRCRACIAHRLERTAQLAAEEGYPWFASTLSVSPHKDAKAINEIGEALERRYGVRYLHSDFKKRGGYQRSVTLSREMGLYRQDHCGCQASLDAERRRAEGLCSLMLLMAFAGWSYAEEQYLDVSVYKQGLVLNGINLSSASLQYPLLLHKDVVYMPVSTEMGVQAGFTSKWDEAAKTLTVIKTDAKTAALPAGAFAHPETVKVQVVSTPVLVGTDNLQTGEYPLLNYMGITYVPLTWSVVSTDLGWKSTHHPMLGLVIQTNGLDPTTVLTSFNTQYYDALAAFIVTRNSGYTQATAVDTVKMIKSNAELHGIDEKWIMAVWWKESNFNSSSISSHGALGAMQIMPGTGERLGYTREQLLDPKYNVEGGTRYLAGLKQNFNNDMFLAVSAYNQGSGTVSRGSFSRSFATDVFKKYETIEAFVKARLGQ